MRPAVFLLALPLALLACSDQEQADSGEVPGEATAVAAAASIPASQPGEYLTEASLLEFDIAGMPAGQVDSLRSTFASELGQANRACLTPEQAQQGPKALVQQMVESDCAVSRLDVAGTTMNGEMQCIGEGGLSGTIRIDGTMASDSASMVIETVQSIPGLPGEGARMKMRFDSRRVGACAA